MLITCHTRSFDSLFGFFPLFTSSKFVCFISFVLQIATKSNRVIATRPDWEGEVVCLQRSSYYKNLRDLSLSLSLSLFPFLFPIFVFLVGMHSFFIDLARNIGGVIHSVVKYVNAGTKRYRSIIPTTWCGLSPTGAHWGPLV